MTQLSLFDGETKKRIGQNQVLDNAKSWKDVAYGAIQHVANIIPEFTSDDVRAYFNDSKIDGPHHCAAWGAVFTSMKKMGKIRQTGRYVKSINPSRNATVVAVWEKVK